MMVLMAGVSGLLLLALGTQRANFGFVRGQGVTRLGDAFG